MKNGTLMTISEVWRILDDPVKLTTWKTEHFFYAFLLLFLTHFIFVWILKTFLSDEFSSQKRIFKKLLHILHQGEGTKRCLGQTLVRLG